MNLASDLLEPAAPSQAAPAASPASPPVPVPVVRLRGVCKSFPGPAGAVQAVNAVDLEVQRGEFLAIAGASGSGKSTLLNLLAGIERADSGELQVAGATLQAASERELTAWRGRSVGVVFQFFQLLPTLTALENVLLPMDFCRRWPAAERLPRAQALLHRLGVADQAAKFPAAMSGGQQQRVALARALANAPALLLADEPTGNLDSAHAASLLDLLAELAQHEQLAIVMVTHSPRAMRRAARCLRMSDGRLDTQAVQHVAD